MKSRSLSRRMFMGATGLGLLSNLLPSRQNPAISAALAGLRGKVKITGVKTAVIQGNYDWNLVKVTTDSGVYGLGEAYKGAGVPDLIRQLGRRIEGQDPLNVDQVYTQMRSAAIGLGGTAVTAASGIEIALWDLAGKLLNAPSYHLLGGIYRDKVSLYCDSGAPRAFEPAAWRDHVRQLVQRPFGFYKIDIDPVTKRRAFPRDPSNRKISNAELDVMTKSVEAARDELGSQPLAVDAHFSYDVRDAIRLAQALEPFDLYWLEDPTPPENADACKRVTDSTSTPICTGENLYGREAFTPFVVNQACDIVQFDITKGGGLLEAKKVADLAELYYIPTAVHNLNSPVGTVACAYVCATMRDFCGLEFKAANPYWWEDMVVREKPVYQHGYVELVDLPGLGIELNEDVCRAHAHPDYGYFL